MLGCAAVPLLVWVSGNYSATLIALIIVAYTICFVLARPRTYPASVFFGTIAVLVLYHFLSPGWSMIEQRAVDTVLGTLIGVLAAYLFPSWEYQRLAVSVRGARRACRQYAKVVLAPGIDIYDYRLARRDVLHALAAVTLAYGRMLEDPVSRQRRVHELGQWLVDCNAFIGEFAASFHRRMRSACAADPMAGQSMSKAAAALIRSDRSLRLSSIDTEPDGPTATAHAAQPTRDSANP